MLIRRESNPRKSHGYQSNLNSKLKSWKKSILSNPNECSLSHTLTYHIHTFLCFFHSSPLTCVWTHPGVNFINVKRTNFSYKRCFGNVHVTWKKLPKPMFVQKICAFNVDEIDPCGQFHQHFKHAFLVWKWIEKLFSNYIRLCNFWHQNIVQKCVQKMSMKLTPVVNLTNILWAVSEPIFLQKKFTNQNCKHIKASKNTFKQKKLLVKCWWNWNL